MWSAALRTLRYDRSRPAKTEIIYIWWKFQGEHSSAAVVVAVHELNLLY